MKKIKEGGLLGYKKKAQRKMNFIKGFAFMIAMFMVVGTYMASPTLEVGSAEIAGGLTLAMAILTDVVEFEGDDAGFFLRPVTENPLITDLGFEIEDDTVNNKYIYLNTEIDKITKKRVGCGWVETGTGATIYRKLINPTDLQVQLSQCSDVFDDTVFRKQLKRGVDVNDLTGTEIEGLLLSFIEPVITRDAMRILWLGDTSLASTNYNQLDGIYKQLAAGVISDGINDAGAITAASLSVANIQATLTTVYNAADIKLRQVPNAEKAFYVTENVWDAWLAWMQTNAALQSSKDQLVNGLDRLFFNGVELIKLTIVDEYLTADFSVGSPSAVVNPRRIVYAKKTNMVLTLDTVSRYNEVKFWYDLTQDLNYTRARYMMAFSYKYPELITIAGF